MNEILTILGTVLTLFGGSMFFSSRRIEDQSLVKLPAFFIGVILLFATLTN